MGVRTGALSAALRLSNCAQTASAPHTVCTSYRACQIRPLNLLSIADRPLWSAMRLARCKWLSLNRTQLYVPIIGCEG